MLENGYLLLIYHLPLGSRVFQGVNIGLVGILGNKYDFDCPQSVDAVFHFDSINGVFDLVQNKLSIGRLKDKVDAQTLITKNKKK